MKGVPPLSSFSYEDVEGMWDIVLTTTLTGNVAAESCLRYYVPRISRISCLLFFYTVVFVVLFFYGCCLATIHQHFSNIFKRTRWIILFYKTYSSFRYYTFMQFKCCVIFKEILKSFKTRTKKSSLLLKSFGIDNPIDISFPRRFIVRYKQVLNLW